VVASWDIFTAWGGFAGWDDVDDPAGILAVMLFDRDCGVQMKLPFIDWSKEAGELLIIGFVKRIVFIDALAIFERFNNRDTLICFKGDDPEA
jgi:hypothetical protein